MKAQAFKGFFLQRLIFCFFLLLPTLAFAAGWEPYVNGRFGYAVEIPPGFALSSEADNGDGRTNANCGATLAVWGPYLAAGPFELDVADRRATYKQEGWDLSYDRQKAGWASLQGNEHPDPDAPLP